MPGEEKRQLIREASLWAGPEAGKGCFAPTDPKRRTLRATLPLPVAHVLREIKKLPLASLVIPVYLLLTK